MSDVKIKRREFVKRAAYAAPMILTLDRSRWRENRAHETESARGARR